MSQSHFPRSSGSLEVLPAGVERSRLPTLVLVPDTPPIGHGEENAEKQQPYHSHDYADGGRSESLHVPSSAVHDRHQSYSPQASTPPQTLTALAIGAPLIASVVSSCTSVICADLTSVLGNDPISRPARASAITALLWCALITSLGSTMTAVTGLAMHAGYHDSHVGITKRIVRFLRQWQKDHWKRGNREHHRRTPSHFEMRAPTPALSAITDGHKDQHAAAAFRAAVVSARLLGTSVALLAIALAIYLFLLYPLSVAIVTTAAGVLTAAVAALPLLPILRPSE